MNKKVLALLLAIAMLAALIGCGAKQNADGSQDGTSAAGNYPKGDINGTIIYGAGGGTDLISRAMGAALNKVLDVSVVMENRTGGGGVVGTEFVKNEKSDGQNICFHSEAITLFRAMDLTDTCIDDFKEIMIYGGSCGTLLVNKNSPYNTVEELIAAAKAAPGSINMGGTGATGCPKIYAMMMEKISGIQFNMVNFDSDGDAMTALLGNQIDCFIPVNTSSLPYVESGDLKCLMVFHNEPVVGFEEVQLATELDSGYDNYLPYGPFFGAAVKADTDQAIIDYLIEKFSAAYESDSFQEYLSRSGVLPICYTGADADEYMNDSEKQIWDMLYEAGISTIDPAGVIG